MQCAVCKGRGWCGLPRCPVLSRFRAQVSVSPSEQYAGCAPSVFVGSRGYPRPRSGPLMSTDADQPPEWIAQELDIEQIIAIRARTIRGTISAQTYLSSLQEIALSSQPLEVEVAFERPPRFDLIFDGTVTPIGLSGSIRRLQVVDHPRVDRVVDRVTTDTDLGAAQGCTILREANIDVYRISQLLTSGLLGRRRRLVPTRWAITATDDMVFSGLRPRLLRAHSLDHIQLFSTTLYGNTIICLLVPGDWSFEMIEIWGKHSLWGGENDIILEDGERQKRTAYSSISGAYYAARLAVAEHLTGIHRTARVLVVRSVSQEYWAPLGTWVIREVTRKALQENPMTFDNIDIAAGAISSLLGSTNWIRHSHLLPRLKSQWVLSDFPGVQP